MASPPPPVFPVGSRVRPLSKFLTEAQLAAVMANDPVPSIAAPATNSSSGSGALLPAPALSTGYFDVPAANIIPLGEPSDYFAALVRGCETAKSRISMAYFYTTTNSREQTLMNTLADRCRTTFESGSQIQVDICVDAFRTGAPCRTKGPVRLDTTHPVLCYESGRHLLVELLQAVPDMSKVHIGMLQLPKTRSSKLVNALPRKFKPRVGQVRAVSHMKFFVFDNDVVITGANVSKSYFTNRQDRYVLFRDVPALANHLQRFVKQLNSIPHSFALWRDGTVQQVEMMQSLVAAAGPIQAPMQVHDDAHGRNGLPPFSMPKCSRKDNAAYRAALAAVLLQYSTQTTDIGSAAVPPGAARIWPAWQLGDVSVHRIDEVTLSLLRGLGPAPSAAVSGGDARRPATCDIATGYMNLTDELLHTIIAETHPQSTIRLLTCSPESMDFADGGNCFSTGVKLSYSSLTKRVNRTIQRAGRASSGSNPSDNTAPGVMICEYCRPKWTFHGKGIWLEQAPHGSLPAKMLTSIGSSNFGMRSSNRDIELQLFVSTEDPELVHRLAAERDALYAPTVHEHRELDESLPTPTDAEHTGEAGVDPAAGGAGELRTQSSRATRQVVCVGSTAPERNVWDEPDRKLKWLSLKQGKWIQPASWACAKFL